MPVEFLQLLAATGDAATIALLAVLWRFDRRILVLETIIKNVKVKLEKLENALGRS